MKKILFLFFVSITLYCQTRTMACVDWVDSVFASKAWVTTSFVKADFVFDDDYDLMSIEEHSKVMLEAHKLPGVKERGTLGILEELEIAHLYIVELKKEIDKLKQRIKWIECGNMYYYSFY